MEYVIQSSMFYSFYLFLFILLCNVDSALVSGSIANIWVLNCANVRIIFNHVHESQYLLQIVKCTDKACCSPFQ